MWLPPVSGDFLPLTQPHAVLVASSDVLLQVGGSPFAAVRPRVRALASVWQALELRRSAFQLIRAVAVLSAPPFE